MARKNQTPPRSFEEALVELEQILAEIEGGAVGLEESLVKYERGNFLIQHCRGVLNAAEQQIELSKGADGELQATPVQEVEETTWKGLASWQTFKRTLLRSSKHV